MELKLELSIFPEVIVYVFCAIVAMILILTAGKILVVQLATRKTKTKEVKEDDNRGDKKRSPKTNVHKSR